MGLKSPIYSKLDEDMKELIAKFMDFDFGEDKAKMSEEEK